MKRILTSLIAAAALAGCVTTAPTPAVFSVDQSAYVLAKGAGQIEGRAYIERDGKVITATGNPVILIPATAYHTQRMRTLYGDAKEKTFGTGPNPETPPEYTKYQRFSSADAAGRFRFDGVAPGNYYVIAIVTVPAATGNQQVGVYDAVTVPAAGIVRIDLTGR